MTTPIGEVLPRPDALGKVTGAASYPGIWFGRDAAPQSGVRAPTTRADCRYRYYCGAGASGRRRGADGPTPFNGYGLIENDQPVLCGDKVRFEGDKVALVVAESKAAAAAAAKSGCELRRPAGRHRPARGDGS